MVKTSLRFVLVPGEDTKRKNQSLRSIKMRVQILSTALEMQKISLQLQEVCVQSTGEALSLGRLKIWFLSPLALPLQKFLHSESESALTYQWTLRSKDSYLFLNIFSTEDAWPTRSFPFIRAYVGEPRNIRFYLQVEKGARKNERS